MHHHLIIAFISTIIAVAAVNSAYHEHIRLVINSNHALGTKKDSPPIEAIGFSWLLQAVRANSGFLSLELKVEPPVGFIGSYHMIAD
jgi:hypothetical protein